MRFGSVWFGFEKLIQSPIQSKRFSQNVIQTHPIIFGFVRFSVLIWIGLDLNTPCITLQIK